VALSIAAIGVFGVTWHAVVQRTREMGVRVALGARPDQVVLMLVAAGGIPIAIGAVLGVGGAAAGTRYMASQLHEVTPLDPLTFAAAPVLVAAVGLLAVFLPAMRARLVDPKDLLRTE
jgi:putative ABC transport system permease protein